MKDFAGLVYELGKSEKGSEQVKAFMSYFKTATEQDTLCALALFMGKRPKRAISSALLKQYACEKAGIPVWLFTESHIAVGDVAETAALIIHDEQATHTDRPLAYWLDYVKTLTDKTEEYRKKAVFAAWVEMGQQERFVFNKILTATFRIGVDEAILIRALSQHTKIHVNVLTHRLAGDWSPKTTSYPELLKEEHADDQISKPYPFWPMKPFDGNIESIGDPLEWLAEWKRDGLQVQLIVRKGQIFIWSRGEVLVTDKFPELEELKELLPDGSVLAGEILPWQDGGFLPINLHQARLARKSPNPKIAKEAPVAFFATDLLEWQGMTVQQQPWHQRRISLQKLINQTGVGTGLQLMPTINFDSWDALDAMRLQARDHLAEGIVLKRKSATHIPGEDEPAALIWKTDAMTVDAVLIYAMKGAGRRENLFTDYTFGVWKGDGLITLTKANKGLTDKEFTEIDQWIRANVIEKFGPVVTVKPELVFELGFDGIERSSRHKSGLVLKSPHILRWRTDKQITDADTLESFEKILTGSIK